MKFLGVWIALAVVVVGGAVRADEQTDKVDALFAAFTAPGSPGCSVGITRDGELIYSKGYGLAQLEYAVPITSDTIFHVASVSKQFTAMAVVLLAEDGKLSLEDEARKYVPEIPDFGHPLRIQHLLNHTSGLRDQWALMTMSGWVWGDIFDTKDILKLVARQKELNFIPGDRDTYSNTGFTLLGVIVERVSGKSLDAFCQERIFGPLGMAHTHFHMSAAHVDPGRAYSYTKKGEVFENSVLSYSTAGATSLFTTVGDLAKWQANFSTWTVGGESARAMMFKPGMLNGGKALTYASGVDTGKYKGLSLISHGGSDAGFRSASIYVPGEKFGVAVLSNLASANAVGLGQSILDIYLADKESKEEAPAPSATASDARAFTKWQGDFVYRETGDLLKFSIEKETFRVIIPGDPPVLLQASGSGKFVPAGAPDWMSFEFSGNDRVRWRTAGGDDRVLERAGQADASPKHLAELAGTYYSPELDVFYRFAATEKGLALRRAKVDERILAPTMRDGFAGEMSSYYFVRDKKGKCTGVRVSSNPRVRHLWFRRVEGFD